MSRSETPAQASRSKDPGPPQPRKAPGSVCHGAEAPAQASGSETPAQASRSKDPDPAQPRKAPGSVCHGAEAPAQASGSESRNGSIAARHASGWS